MGVKWVRHECAKPHTIICVGCGETVAHSDIWDAQPLTEAGKPILFRYAFCPNCQRTKHPVAAWRAAHDSDPTHDHLVY